MYQEPAKFAKIAGVEVTKFSNLMKTNANEGLMTFLSVFGVVCQPLSLIELEKGHFARYFKKFFVFFQKHLAKHALPDSKDRRTRKMRKATASP
jgi:hypothetical protein